ncbi:deoxycytidylate deaminase [Syntrophomonas palmitatica]|uniref:deoxycytidylate deaminase n=1 Tax=Syntrophomonas palmitatica TaxID=402877 RepID=UPI0006D03848|nr:dCMP deaminase family protein [Syntrophomonas palmitatica]
MRNRPSKIDYYLNIALDVASRGTCLRRNYGAVIVKDDTIVATGYSGAPRGLPNCCDLETCEREKAGVPRGERYELCRSVHAEMNAIINAGREKTLGATLYLACYEVKTGAVIDAEPCFLCKRIIINAGIYKVVCRNADGGSHAIIPEGHPEYQT